MSKTQNYLAVDLGAESGRVMLGQFDGERITLDEIHRFPNTPVGIPLKTGKISLRWDILRIWADIKQGIARAVRKENKIITGIGLDTWGVDFGLLDRRGSLVGNPYYYRDSRTDGMLDEAFRRVSREKIFEATGVQFMQINSLYQLLAMVLEKSPELEITETFLTMPDIFNYWLTGQISCEFTHTTTTQCYDPRQRAWAVPLLDALNIPSHIFPKVIQPGSVLGKILPALSEELNTQASVIVPACHDTGSAVAAVPAKDDNFIWISSGTWSILGTNVKEAVISAQSLENNFTNEGNVDGSYRFSKNIMGLWIVQDCRRSWSAAGEDLSYSELTEMASKAPAFVSLLDPDSKDFLHTGDMPGRIRTYCQRTKQIIPQDKGTIIRCTLESIALKYRFVLERLETMVGQRLGPIHIVGGGTKNKLLNQFTADATGRQVITGPIEATAIGSILAQAIGLGHISSLEQSRQIVNRSFEMDIFEPGDQEPWHQAYHRFLTLMDQGK